MSSDPIHDRESGPESARLDAVRRLALVGTAPEPDFDRLVRLASTVVDVPMAWISFVDADRSWFKAKVGLELGEASREAAFCSHVILQDQREPFVVADAWMDERFENNPLVIASPRIRFFAGVPLLAAGGEAVGTLSVADREPRTLTGRERLALLDLATLAEELLDVPAVEFAGPDLAPVVHDTDTARQLADLEARVEATELLLERTTDVIVVLDAAAQITFASPSFRRVLGFDADFRHADGALALIHPEDRPLARSRITTAMADTTVTDPFTIRVRTAAGSIRNMECTAQNRFSARSVHGVVVVMRDVSDRHLLSQMLAFQSTHDRLTELPNQMLFQEHLTPALARSRRDRRPVAVCFLDVSGFQELNHELGRAAGDELLVDVAKRIRSSIRNGDSAARIGGDEFAVLLDPVTDAAEAARVAERLVAAVSGPHSLQAGVSDCGANAGVAMSADVDDAASIVARASRALTQAKRGGRGEIVLSPADGQLTESRPNRFDA